MRRLAVHVEDHPLEYATFEGNIPEGHYGAGDVIVWDRGVWTPQGDPHEGYRKGKLKFSLEGEKLAGSWNLVRTQMDGKKEQWFLIKSRDEAAREESEYDIVTAEPDSVLSDRTLVPRKRGAKARVAKPRLRQSRHPPEADTGGRKAKVALEGPFRPSYRSISNRSWPPWSIRYRAGTGGTRSSSTATGCSRASTLARSGCLPATATTGRRRCPSRPRRLRDSGSESGWLDGEVVVPNEEGTPDFQALQNAFEAGRSGSILYYLFDMPYLNGMDLREVALEQRRAALREVLERSDSELLRFSEDFTEQPDSILESACQMKLEGLIGKRAGSTYTSRRSSSWVKIKCSNRQEFIIVGYTQPKGTRTGFARCCSACTTTRASCVTPARSAPASTMQRCRACTRS